MDVIDTKSVGRRVAAYRRTTGMTTEELARRVGADMTANAITKLEKGHRAQVSPGLVVDLANALAVSPLALLFPMDEPDAELIIGGTRGTVRSFGSWLLGSFPSGDILTQTFGQLVATDRVVAIAEQRVEDAAPEARQEARQRLEDEKTMQYVLEQHLRRLHEVLFPRGDGDKSGGSSDGEHQAEA